MGSPQPVETFACEPPHKGNASHAGKNRMALHCPVSFVYGSGKLPELG
ncbi:Uncharacterised protein [Mycobacteroides abscessus subsp. abscessus]|nr:Uncharacterised protein [Mycobacteroides abscessus subsp. abscessus]